MDADSWLSIAVIAAAAVLLFIVAASEAAIIYISRTRTRLVIGATDQRSEALQRYMAERQRTLSALNLGRNLAVVAGMAATLHLLSGAHGLTWGEAALTALVALLVIGVIDGIPDVVASRNPEFWALVLTPVLRVLGLIFNPLALVLDLPGRIVARLPIVPKPAQEVEEEEMLLRLMEMQRPGAIEDEERQMIRGVIGLEETTAREIMVPRIDIAALPNTATLDDAIGVVVERGYSRIPLYEGQIDNICGIVYAKDVLRHLRGHDEPPVSLTQIARPPYFIPETKKVDELLAEFRQQKIHIAIVVDEYGGTAGLVTAEDILEEIVGEIEDEYDTGEPQVERISETEAIVDARLPLDDLNELLDADLEDDEVDTVGGLVFNQLGKMPAPGDEVRVDGVVIQVLDVQGNRIRKVHVEKIAGEPAESGK